MQSQSSAAAGQLEDQPNFSRLLEPGARVRDALASEVAAEIAIPQRNPHSPPGAGLAPPLLFDLEVFGIQNARALTLPSGRDARARECRDPTAPTTDASAG